MRAFHERPRVAVAKLLVVLTALVGAGAAGSAFAGGTDQSALNAETKRTSSARSASTELASALATTRRDLSAAREDVTVQTTAQQKANRKLKTARRQATRDARKLRRLKGQLRRARRANR